MANLLGLARYLRSPQGCAWDREQKAHNFAKFLQDESQELVEALDEEGVDVKPMHLRRWHRSDIITEILDAGAIVVGSPTLNNGLFPTVSDFLCYMKGLKPKNKVAAAFGSYGWSGEAVKFINKELEDMKFELIDPGLNVKYVPDETDIEACHQLGKKVVQALSRIEE